MEQEIDVSAGCVLPYVHGWYLPFWAIPSTHDESVIYRFRQIRNSLVPEHTGASLKRIYHMLLSFRSHPIPSLNDLSTKGGV